VKKECSRPCADCNGSGMVNKPIEYPDLANQQWCSCESGRAKAEQIAAIVRGTLAGRRLIAA